MIVSSATILKIIESVLNCLSKLYLQLESLRESQRKKLLRKQWKIKKNRSDNNKIDPRYIRKENVIIRISIQYLLVIRNLFSGEQKDVRNDNGGTNGYMHYTSQQFTSYQNNIIHDNKPKVFTKRTHAMRQ